jgi:hypothetical protein
LRVAAVPPPGFAVRLRPVLAVMVVNVGDAVQVIAGVVPPEDERFPLAVTDVTGVVISAEFGIVPDVIFAP